MPPDEIDATGVAMELADRLEMAVPGWIERLGVSRIAAAGRGASAQEREALRRAGEDVVDSIGSRLRAVLMADVDAGAGSPLAVLRTGLGPATETLRAMGVPPVARDEFAVDHFPDDVYDLSPASFADIDESLVEPGVVWGATRAHVHLRRRQIDR